MVSRSVALPCITFPGDNPYLISLVQEFLYGPHVHMHTLMQHLWHKNPDGVPRLRLEHWNSSQLRLFLFDSKTNRHGTYYSLLLQYYSLCGNPVVATAIVTTMLVGLMYVHCRWV